MTGSWIGRSLVALLGLLVSVAAGLIVAGTGGAWVPSIIVSASIAGVVLVRACTIGVLIDLEREQVVLRSFWWTRRIAVDELRSVGARRVGDGWPPGVWFETQDGREHASMALCYLDEDRAGELIVRLRQLAGPGATVELRPDSFRPPTS